MTILDGRDGRPLLDPYPRDSVGAQTSPLTLSAEGRGNDLFLYWIADCTGHEGDGGQFGFRKGNCRAMITRMVCHSSTISLLAFLFKKVQEAGEISVAVSLLGAQPCVGMKGTDVCFK